ncbi:MAG: thioredoxin family protein [Bacteroidia bacterium]|nr:thioredoxin family protein [Bacteroidia bacterium]
MKIKILGTGCAGCKALFATVQKAVSEMNIQAEIVKEEDLMKIMQYDVMSLPAIVVDEKVVAKGNLSLSEVESLLKKLQEEKR